MMVFVSTSVRPSGVRDHAQNKLMTDSTTLNLLDFLNFFLAISEQKQEQNGASQPVLLHCGGDRVDQRLRLWDHWHCHVHFRVTQTQAQGLLLHIPHRLGNLRLPFPILCRGHVWIANDIGLVCY